MGTFHTGAFRALGALSLLATSATASAQFEPDANTAGLWHFDTQSAQGTTPDSGPGGFDGTLEGAVLPTHQAATVGGFGNAYEFDGVDRGAGSNSRINMGSDAALGLRGGGDFTLDILLTVTAPLIDDGYFRGIVCRASGEGIDYSLSYLSWTRPVEGTGEHQFWFSTGPGPDSTTEYAYAAVAFEGVMQVGQSYAIRATVAAGAMSITVNGVAGASTYYPAQPGVLSPTATPVSAALTVGDSCPQDYVVKPSELQLDELRISTVAQSDLPLINDLGTLVPIDLGLGASAAAFEAYRLDHLVPELLAAPQPTVAPLLTPTTPLAPTGGLRLRRSRARDGRAGPSSRHAAPASAGTPGRRARPCSAP